jgi:penicillin-binding protein 1A
MGGAGMATGCGIMLSRIPSVQALLASRPATSTTIYDRQGRLVASLQNGQNRQIVPLSEISINVQHAVIASEDIRFYQHHGVDPYGVARAILSGGTAGGGSTITQQLAKNLFLSFNRTLSRKLEDMWLAIQLERTLSKQQILEMYLNQVLFGRGAYGVEAASRAYFHKNAANLSVSEAAFLAGILPAPEYYGNPHHLKEAMEIQKIVLRRMVAAGFLDEATEMQVAARPLHIYDSYDYAYKAPYFISQVLSMLTERLGADYVMRGGLKIYTTLDLPLQEYAERVVRQGVAGYTRQHVSQGALVAIEPGTGEVRALVGGTSYSKSQFNRATQALRQPGSAFKPFVYLTAFDQGYHLGSQIDDSPVSFGNYTPHDFEHTFQGTVTFEHALVDSLNVPALKIANQVGIDNVIKTAHAAGIKSDIPRNLSIALGSAEVTPLELADAYATFAANGAYAEPLFVTRIEDHDGHVIEQSQPSSSQVISESAVQTLDRALEAVIQRGTGTAADIGRPAAGKTGTSSDSRDTWFAGYTPDLACVVWLGNDNDSPLAHDVTGGQLAAPLWRRFMLEAHRGLPVRDIIKEAVPVQSAPEPSGTQALLVPAQNATGTLPQTLKSRTPASAQDQPGQPLDEPLPSDAPSSPPLGVNNGQEVPPMEAEPSAAPSMDVVP